MSPLTMMNASRTQPDSMPSVPRPGYLAIEDHGIVGDLHSVALIGTDGNVNWYCPGRFDGPSVFAALMDQERGGYYRISPVSTGSRTRQLYFPETNVLITRFLSAEGIAEIQDFMPIGGPAQQLIRRVVATRGTVRFRLELEPRFGYGRDRHEITPTAGGVTFTSPDSSVSFAASSLNAEQTATGLRAEFDLRAGESRTFVLQTSGEATPLTEQEAEEQLRATLAYWRSWLAQSSYTGRWREMVHRSALTLKLLNYAPTGAMIAAPTTSLPECPGGARNWDYRFAWVRDFAFSLYALVRLGFGDEARAASHFAREIAGRLRPDASNGPLRVVYRVDGDVDLAEQELDHLEGYQGSRPVRIGNSAAGQFQLDIYGALLDSVYLYEQQAMQGRGELLPYGAWRVFAALVDWLCDHWHEPDDGIWEVRNGRRRFTYSQVMCWVALDRAIRIATQRAFPAKLERWTAERDAVFAWIMERGWSEKRQAFVQAEGSQVLDASLLLMPLVGLIAPTDPRWLSTLDAMSEDIVSDSLVYRYDPAAAPDGLDGDEGTFSMCSFWYVECLANAGRLEEAQLVFEKMLTYANHLGLYSEEIGAGGELLGNFPQAFTHLALIRAALSLDPRLDQNR